MATIRVRARHTPLPGRAHPPMVTDLAAQNRGTKKFVGWKHDPTLGDEFDHFFDRPDGSLGSEKRKSGGFVGHNDVAELDVSHPEHAKFYREALVDGELLPADAETAAWAGITFDAPKSSAPTTEPTGEATASTTTKKGG